MQEQLEINDEGQVHPISKMNAYLNLINDG